MDSTSSTIIDHFLKFIGGDTFSCVAAKAAVAKDHLKCFVADHMACPKDDTAILNFLYEFVDGYRASTKSFHSAVIIFKEQTGEGEQLFDKMMWRLLQSLSNMDALQYKYDSRVSDDPSSPEFSFSLKQEAFFVIGLHPFSSRATRRFDYPAIVFNPHNQFTDLRLKNQYEKMQTIVRKKDIETSGSLNPMLTNFGERSEVFQYSGREYSKDWQCPLKQQHEPDTDYSAT